MSIRTITPQSMSMHSASPASRDRQRAKAENRHGPGLRDSTGTVRSGFKRLGERASKLRRQLLRRKRRSRRIEQAAQRGHVRVIARAGIIKVAEIPLARTSGAKFSADNRHVAVADHAIEVGIGTARELNE